MRRQGSALDPLRRRGQEAPAAPADGIWVPEDVELDGEDLVWRAEGRKIRCTEERPGAGLLEAFLEMESAPARRVRGFAKRWGPLGLRDTNLPTGRSFPWRPRKSFERGPTDAIVDWPKGEYRESVVEWRGWATQANSLLRICATLRGGQRGKPEDWNGVHEQQAWTGVNFEVVSAREALALEWGAVVHALQEWIARGRVRPNVHYKWFRAPAGLSDRSWRLRLSLGGDRLLGALAVQLLFAASRTRGIFLCDGCGKEFRPKRNPNPNQMRFCAKCDKDGVANRLAARTYYAKNKAKIQKRRKQRAKANHR